MIFPIHLSACWQVVFVLYLLASTVQLVVWWGVFARIIFKRNRHIQCPANGQQVSVSVILCARNEAENLRRHLPEILSQRFDAEWELLVVDDASEDETADVLANFKRQYPYRLQVLRMEAKTSLGKKEALSTGIEKAKFDHLLLTDADCVPGSPFWLEQMSAKLCHKAGTEIVLGYGPLRGRAFFRYEAAFTAAQYFGFALIGMPYMGVGRNLAFKREVYDRVGGFSAHSDLASGDDDLLVNQVANARNTAICMRPETFVYSTAPPDLGAWLQQKRRHLSAGPHYRWLHQLLLGMLALSHAGHYFLFALLLMAGTNHSIVLGIFFLRLLSVGFVSGNILKKFRESDLLLWIPWFDAMLAFYYGAIVPWMLFSKKRIIWK